MEHSSASAYEKLIDDTVQQVKTIFQEIKEMKIIPLATIRTNIAPVIHQLAEQPVLFELIAALRPKDDYIDRHHLAVGIISTLLGKWYNLESQELMKLTTAAFLSDVGKTQIPNEILYKPASLSIEEFRIVKQHTVIGYQMMKKTPWTTYRQALAILQHHERMDGSGYPLGLYSEQIDLFSRIIAVADVFHAINSKRVYRGPASLHESFTHLEQLSGGKLDPKVVKLFISNMMPSLVRNNA